MPVEFDRQTGHLRLDQPLFDALSSWASGGRIDERAMVQFVETGVIDRGRPNPELEAGLDAVTRPVCRLQIQIRNAKGRLETERGWVNGAAAALLLQLPGVQREFVTLHPTFLPAALARVVVLQPRPRIQGEPLQLPRPLFEQFLVADAEQRAAAVATFLADAGDHGDSEQLARTAHALASGLRWAWMVRATWSAPQDRPSERTLRVLDTEAGLWLVESGTTGPVVWPTTPTTVWRMLVTLLPRDEELA